MKQFIANWLAENHESFSNISSEIWGLAEMRFCENKSVDLISSKLAQAGFKVQDNLANIKTAFCAEYGQGKPIIAILGEYDALAGMSQKPMSTVQEPLVNGGCGHGCGHNLLGTGALAAALAIKETMVKYNLPGTIRFYGCPGEEGGSGKTFMARAGVFDDLDAALTWHPFGNNAVMSVPMLANFQVAFKFHGRSAHAAASPHLGRSALDAVELMNIAVNYLREHVIPEARMHYAVTNTGGHSPNVVQAEAEVLYLLRAPKLNQVEEIYARVCDIAKGAALMTGTTMEICFEKACSNVVPNQAVERLMHKNFMKIGAPPFDAADKEFAAAMAKTLTKNDLDNELKMSEIFMGPVCEQEILDKLLAHPLSETILPYSFSTTLLPGSSDVGDVSWIIPTAQCAVACQAFGTPVHSWQAVSQGKSPLAHKGMLTAAQVLAATAVDLFQQPQVLEQAQAEHHKQFGGVKYKSPIPENVQPKPFCK